VIVRIWLNPRNRWNQLISASVRSPGYATGEGGRDQIDGRILGNDRVKWLGVKLLEVGEEVFIHPPLGQISAGSYWSNSKWTLCALLWQQLPLTDSIDEVPKRGSSCNLQLTGQRLLWEANPRPDDSRMVRHRRVLQDRQREREREREREEFICHISQQNVNIYTKLIQTMAGCQ